MPGNLFQSELEWLVIILVYNNSFYDQDFKNMPGYVTLESQKESLFCAIKDSVNSKEIKVILIETRFYDEEIVTNVIEKKENRLEKIEKPVEGDDHFTMVSEDSMAGLLKIALDQFKAKRHIIITFGHGSIFGINFTSSSINNFSVQPTFCDSNHQQPEGFNPDDRVGLNRIPGGSAEKKQIRYSDFDLGKDLRGSILTNQNLSESIKRNFPDKKVDVLVMYNCLMQNVNTQYDLRQAVDYLVAPLSGICHPGYNYEGVLKKLADDTKMSNKKVAALFCDKDIIQNNKHYKLFENDIENTWYISSVKLEEKKYDELKSRFTEFVDEILRLKISNDQIFRCIKDTINQLFGYNRYCIPDVKIVDLNVFLIQLRKKTINSAEVKTILRHIDGMIELLSSIDTESFCGKNFYPFDQFYVDKEIEVKKGFGFFMPKKPTRKLLFDKLFEGNVLPYTPGMWENTSYVKFIQQFQQWNGDFI